MQHITSSTSNLKIQFETRRSNLKPNTRPCLLSSFAPLIVGHVFFSIFPHLLISTSFCCCSVRSPAPCRIAFNVKKELVILQFSSFPVTLFYTHLLPLHCCHRCIPAQMGTGKGPQDWVHNSDIMASAPLLACFTGKAAPLSLSLFALWTSSAEESPDKISGFLLEDKFQSPFFYPKDNVRFEGKAKALNNDVISEAGVRLNRSSSKFDEGTEAEEESSIEGLEGQNRNSTVEHSGSSNNKTKAEEVDDVSWESEMEGNMTIINSLNQTSAGNETANDSGSTHICTGDDTAMVARATFVLTSQEHIELCDRSVVLQIC
ncbi:hypothetical protein COLO4_19540 [Corchorus olitorius]|uniref:Uncharacterized protein n=1 Tax=Corchorus olitorius TaxID=93759 RepID=A0A1R3J530_9ROSI|nr:hypothetical protein COLO4_19540 [Corchorus olitorius]